MLSFRRFLPALCLGAVLIAGAAASVAEPGAEPIIDREQVEQITRMLPARPEGPGRPIADRAFWENLGRNLAYAALLTDARKYLAHPLPPLPDDLYLEFSRTGNRTRYQSVNSARRNRLAPLVLAECLENKGQFLPAIEELITTVCAERSWVLPAHDRNNENFYGRRITIDLASSALAWNLAVADWLLGERLRPEVRSLLRENVERRVLNPFRTMIRGEREPDHWLSVKNNWNAVCLAGVAGAALVEIEPAAERAEVVAAAEKLIGHFLDGFTSDGYCSEGVGYWNYGFGHFALLSETLRGATGGQIDLLAQPRAHSPARYASRIEIINGVYPAFADCHVLARPDAALMWLLNRRLGIGAGAPVELHWPATLATLPEAMLYAAAASGDAAGPSPTVEGGTSDVSSEHSSPIRDWFGEAGILISRPHPGSSCRIGVALKGGHNSEQHNHNDLGSYVVVLGKRAVLLDPGLETYTARTFSRQRYESPMLNSYGHPVPVVAGRLQESGSKARAGVLETAFTTQTDTLRLDLSSAYKVPELDRLERAFVYSREGEGALTVTDTVVFSMPQAFETALITSGTWHQMDTDTLLVTDREETLKVTIDTGGVPYELKDEVIRENAPVQPTRIAIRLREPVKDARVRVIITPQ